MITLIGDGRVAKHLCHWFGSLSVDYNRWNRASQTSLEASIAGSTHVLLLISDGAIPSFYEENPSLWQRTCIHFSGSLYHEQILGFHPLMTFSNQLYDPEFYSSIPFVVDSPEEFQRAFPFLDNEAISLAPKDRALYHGLCAAAGNFSMILWKAVAERLQNIGIDPSLLGPYLRKNLENFLQAPHGEALTGPLVRGDHQTITSHLDALRGDPLKKLYQGFVQFYGEDC